MPKTYNMGGQRRTATLMCGWSCVGHPNEVDAKTRRHYRVCSKCKEDGTSCNEIPKFDKVVGMSNGWKGVSGRFDKVDGGLTSIVIGGEKVVVETKGTTAEQRTEKAKEMAQIIQALKEQGLDIDDVIIANP